MFPDTQNEWKENEKPELKNIILFALKIVRNKFIHDVEDICTKSYKALLKII